MLRFTFLLPILALGACAYVTDGSVQDVTVLTPGANNAECKLSVGGVQYVYNPPMTRSIQKSGENMVVDCWAPGNRHKVGHFSAVQSNTMLFNGPNVGGMVFDVASNSIHNYPSVVEIDFTQTEVKPFPLPAQNQEDIRPPEDYDLEEFSPGLPRLNSDRFATKPEIRRRQTPESFDLQGFAGREEGGADYGFDEDDASASAPGVRVIGRTNEGVAVPTPPSPEQQAAASAARAAERESSRAAAQQQQASEPAESTTEQSGEGAVEGEGESASPAEGGDDQPENLLPK